MKSHLVDTGFLAGKKRRFVQVTGKIFLLPAGPLGLPPAKFEVSVVPPPIEILRSVQIVPITSRVRYPSGSVRSLAAGGDLGFPTAGPPPALCNVNFGCMHAAPNVTERGPRHPTGRERRNGGEGEACEKHVGIERSTSHPGALVTPFSQFCLP